MKSKIDFDQISELKSHPISQNIKNEIQGIMDNLGYFNVQKLIEEGYFKIGKKKDNPEEVAATELSISSKCSYENGQQFPEVMNGICREVAYEKNKFIEIYETSNISQKNEHDKIEKENYFWGRRIKI